MVLISYFDLFSVIYNINLKYVCQKNSPEISMRNKKNIQLQTLLTLLIVAYKLRTCSRDFQKSVNCSSLFHINMKGYTCTLLVQADLMNNIKRLKYVCVCLSYVERERERERKRKACPLHSFYKA